MTRNELRIKEVVKHMMSLTKKSAEKLSWYHYATPFQ